MCDKRPERDKEFHCNKESLKKTRWVGLNKAVQLCEFTVVSPVGVHTKQRRRLPMACCDKMTLHNMFPTLKHSDGNNSKSRKRFRAQFLPMNSMPR